MLDAALAHYNRAERRTKHASGTRYYERALAWERAWRDLADRYFVACYGAYR
jgi:hypothetical protein